MLVRIFRFTDKFNNALLKVAIYGQMLLLQRMADFRHALETTAKALLLTLVGTFAFLLGSIRAFLALFTRRTQAVAVERQERIRQVMVQRAEKAAIARQKDLEVGKVVEDPMLARNRSLSAITVILLIILIVFLVSSPAENQSGLGGLGSGGAGIIPTARLSDADPQIPTPSATPTQPSQILSNVSGTLVFAVRQNGQEDIWALPVGSTQPIRLTDSLVDDRDPAWSPDGGKIAFTSQRNGYWNLYIIDLTQGQTTQLTFGQQYVGSPAWSPDGQFLVYEGYNADSGNIDLYLVSQNGELVPRALTSSPYPDLEPHWSPQGREIVYVGWRNGSRDILVLNLDGQPEEAALNITDSPDVDESFPQWSPEGGRIAYTATQNGIDGIYVKSIVTPTDPARLIGRGRMPTWNPIDGSSVFYTVPQGSNSAVYLGQVDNFGVGANAIAFQGQVTDLDWTASVHNISGFDPRTPSLYEEQILQRGRFALIALDNVNSPDPVLSDAVNDSFDAMRRRVLDKAGVDLLGTLESAIWRRERLPEPGQDKQSWHYTGRAISLPRNLVLEGEPTPIVVMREDTELGTQWRVMVRVSDEAQDGRLGEPLRTLPWDFGARFADDPVAFQEGGRLMTTIPAGYYVDLTQIIMDFGWERLPADRTWRSNYAGVLFWQFQKTEGLAWREAMLQIYSEAEVTEFELGIVVPLATAIPTFTPEEAIVTPRGPRQGTATAIPLVTNTPTLPVVTPATPLPTNTP